MSNRFRSTTHTTPLQQAIEKVTDGNQPNEDWDLIMKICDHVGTHEESAKEAIKIIRKRLHMNPVASGWRTIGLTLTLLEALVKNCGKIFHLQIAHRDFLKELKTVIGPKNNPPIPVQTRVLAMIQTWALAFRHDPDLKTVDQFYQECKQQGLEFPPAESENVIKAAVPATTTLRKSATTSRTTSQHNQATLDHQSILPHDGSSNVRTSNQAMPPEQVAKLRSELDVVQTNIQVFGEMLVTLQPADENPQDFELLTELNNTCRQMQNRIVELLGQVSIDDITVDLLRYNDEFNNLFKTFDNYIQQRHQRFTSSHMPISQTRITTSIPQTTTKTVVPKPSYNPADEPALIQFDDEPTTLTSNLQNMQINSSSKSNNQQQNVTFRTSQPIANDTESDIREVEQWLKIQGDDTDDINDFTHQDDGTTAAFNNFLQKRASTIPDESTSRQNMYPNLSASSTNNRTNSNYL